MRKIAAFLYVMIFAFGEVWGYLKSGSWNIRDWGFFTSKYISIWWIFMGVAVTIVCGAKVILNKVVKDENERIKAEREFNGL